MSAAALRARPTVGFRQAWSAEVQRWHRSAAALVPLFGFAVALMQAVVGLASQRTQGWQGVLGWNTLWTTGLAQPAAAVVLVAAQRREQRARGGGTWWRPVTSLTAGLARLLCCAVMVVIMNAMVLLPTIPAGLLQVGGPAPVTRILAGVGLVTLGAVSLFGVYDLIASRFGILIVLIVAVCWQVTGVLTAERPHWWLIPPAWPIRATLPILGVHANGVALEQASPVRTESPVPALLLIVAVAVVVTLVFVVFRIRADDTGSVAAGPATGRGMSKPGTEPTGTSAQSPVMLRQSLPHTVPGVPRPTAAAEEPMAGLGRPPTNLKPSAPVRAQLRVQLPSVISWLAIAAVIFQLAVWATWRSVSYSTGAFELVVLPVGVTILAIVGWQLSADAWRAVCTRGVGFARLTVAQLSALAAVLLAVSMLSGLIEIGAGTAPGRAGRGLILALTVGWMLLVLSYWLAVRLSYGVALGVLGLGLIASLVLGSGETAQRLWLFGPWIWVHTAAGCWERTAVVAVLTAAIGSALVPAVIAALKRRAALS